ncbi:NADH-ubiquinone oxidoreductase-F iron-sulfur binding region domain-containing protein [Streptomyces sp. NBC_01465]|uniref:NADH-ubiquinone oxidoreductase-F iron-sulfur binding region domain-containing protein n=1 Tax=Streptomyces sp. NBC_01465 TaxID=2903878 RepID=UPI002E35D094|nr:NADH-ubiquinone oxidoreductase-F iron-sulfur binding region domain-containing protein [Streptomyces sp. NBC_01465]
MTTAIRTLPGRLLPPEGTEPLAHGPLPATLRLDAVEASGLTGRGGAAFPVHRKLAAVAAAGGSPVVVANGSEGEPASAKDKTLLARNPQLVLDGLQLAAGFLGAKAAFLTLEEGTGLTRTLRDAIASRPHDPRPVHLTEVPARFLSGESSALAEHLSGRPARPRHPQPPVREQGVGGAPTLVQNVETLAHLALIARYGPDWFRTAGTASEPGTMLCTVHTATAPPQVVETPVGTPLRRLLPLDGASAVLIGGYHGAWLPAADAARLNLGAKSLTPYGAAPGAGVLAALPADRCGLVETARVLRYLALQSAGQCGPCLNGLPRIAGAFSQLAHPGPQSTLRQDVTRWSGLVEGRGACHHPDGTVRLVRSALTVFAAELDHHATGHCTASDFTPLLPVPEETPR